MPNDADILYALFDAALKAALPDGQFEGRLPEKPKGRTIVLGAGKASARMAACNPASSGTGCAASTISTDCVGTACP